MRDVIKKKKESLGLEDSSAVQSSWLPELQVWFLSGSQPPVIPAPGIQHLLHDVKAESLYEIVPYISDTGVSYKVKTKLSFKLKMCLLLLLCLVGKSEEHSVPCQAVVSEGNV